MKKQQKQIKYKTLWELNYWQFNIKMITKIFFYKNSMSFLPDLIHLHMLERKEKKKKKKEKDSSSLCMTTEFLKMHKKKKKKKWLLKKKIK